MLCHKAERPHRMPGTDNDAERRQRRPPLRLRPVGKRLDDSSKGWTDTARNRDVRRTQARTNHWQWQRSLRCDARMRILAGNRRHAVSSDVLSQTFGIDTQSTGYVFVIRHIII